MTSPAARPCWRNERTINERTRCARATLPVTRQLPVVTVMGRLPPVVQAVPAQRAELRAETAAVEATQRRHTFRVPVVSWAGEVRVGFTRSVVALVRHPSLLAHARHKNGVWRIQGRAVP